MLYDKGCKGYLTKYAEEGLTVRAVRMHVAGQLCLPTNTMHAGECLQARKCLL